MPKTTPPAPKTTQALNDIEFSSPGVYSVHNPPALSQTTAVLASVQDDDPGTVGQPKRVLLRTVASMHAHSQQLLNQAKREICIYSESLDPGLYDKDEVYELCKAFLLAHERNRLRILIRDSQGIAQQGHRLLGLTQRLHSRCQIKRVNSDYDFADENWLIVDAHALFVRQSETDKQASVHYYDPVLGHKKQQEFDAMWSVAKVDVNLRRMPL